MTYISSTLGDVGRADQKNSTTFQKEQYLHMC